MEYDALKPAAPAPPADVPTRILAAAVTLLAEQGIGGLTQPKVARAAGVRQGHLTYYFPTRADLLLAVVTQSMSGLMSGLAQGIEDGSLTLQTLAAGLAQGVTDQRRARLVLALVAASDEDPRIKESLRQLVRTLRAQLAGLLHKLGADVDPDTIAACHTLMVGTAVLNVARDDAASRGEAHMLTRFLIDRLVRPAHGSSNGAVRRRRSPVRSRS